MLPFLKRKDQQIAGMIIKNRKPDEKPAEEKEELKDNAAHEACARDLLKAIEQKDIKGIAEALYHAFELMEAEPHVEGEHIEKHSYEDQNRKAAE